MKIWMKVTQDKYSLPEYVAGSAMELANMLGISPNNIYSYVSKVKDGYIRTPYPKYVSVEIEDDDEK